MLFREVLLFVVPLFIACHDSNAGDGGPAPNVSFATVNLTATAPGSSIVNLSHPLITVCRVITATGAIRRDTDAGVATGEVAGDSFFTLAPGSRFGIKNGTTTRETIFEGPSDVRVCVNGDEEMWMTTGVFTSIAGAGESPGAEVWVVTPEGVVRYGSGAHLKIIASASRAELQLSSGSASAYPIDSIFASRDGGRDAPPSANASDGWYAVPIGAAWTLASKKASAQVIGECEQAAKAASDLAAQIASRDASLTEAAPRHVVLRQRARAVCAVSELLAVRTADPAERERLLPRARAASSKWRASSP